MPDSTIALFLSLRSAHRLADALMQDSAVQYAEAGSVYSRGELLGYKVSYRTTTGEWIPVTESMLSIELENPNG